MKNICLDPNSHLYNHAIYISQRENFVSCRILQCLAAQVGGLKAPVQLAGDVSLPEDGDLDRRKEHVAAADCR